MSQVDRLSVVVDEPEPLVRIRDARIHFLLSRTAVVRAIDGIDLDILPGEIFGIIGESGSGKSTLGRAIVGLEKVTGGTITLPDGDPAQLRGAARRAYQMIFQDPAGALNPRRRILASVAEPLVVEGRLSGSEIRARALECMGFVGLGPEYSDRYPHEMSGGQKQRVNIARILTMKPKLIVCDEAVAALDVSIQADIVNLFNDLNREFGICNIFIAHDLNVVAHISARIAVMYLGRVVEMGPVKEVMSAPLHPYTRSLMQSSPIPLPASLRGRMPPALSGEIPSPLNPPSGCRFRTRCPHTKDLCAQRAPEPRELTPGHVVECHFAGDL